MIKKGLFAIILGVSILLAGCGSNNNENGQAVTDNAGEMENGDLLDQFVAGKIPADGNGWYEMPLFYISDLNMSGANEYSYSIGEKVDLDNDGEKELIINGPYGGMFLDISGDKVNVFLSGIVTAENISYTRHEDENWIVHSILEDNRKYYNLEKYAGADTVTESFILEMLCLPEDEGGETVYYRNGNEITEAEYNELFNAYFPKEAK